MTVNRLAVIADGARVGSFPALKVYNSVNKGPMMNRQRPSIAERALFFLITSWWAGILAGLLILGVTAAFMYACILDEQYGQATGGAILGGGMGLMFLGFGIANLFSKDKL